MNIFELVQAALARQARPGISGWGLNNNYPELFEAREIEPASGCTSETCSHFSHDPATSVVALFVRPGYNLVELGGESDSYAYYRYFAVVDGDQNARFFQMTEEGAYHARLREVAAEQVPDWALLSLAQPA